MALNAVLGVWGFLLQEKPKWGNVMIRLAFGKITFVSKKDRLLMGRDWRQKDQLGSYCSCGGEK